MHDPAIKVEGLAKRYKVASPSKSAQTVSGAWARLLKYPIDRFRSLGSRYGDDETFWALRDASFDVAQGEVLGIVGRNGAGKSTLLKVLSRITEPTQGRAIIRGRIGSLLEVGTGFHPELTGRENIYLNGALLGMRRSEITARLDEIVEFAEVHRFIDTPVKRYSTGMRVRLAFAVAAHLETEILFVDEVLAVGDAAFQKRCLGKMGDVATQGRTVLLVSHQLAAIEGLCHRCIWLEDGQVAMEGAPSETISAYLRVILDHKGTDLASDTIDRTGSGKARITGFHLEDDEGRRMPSVQSGRPAVFVLTYTGENRDTLRNLTMRFGILDDYGRALFVHSNDYSGETLNAPGSGQMRFRVPRFPIAQGRYKAHAQLYVNQQLADWPKEGVGIVDVVQGDFYRTGSLGWTGDAPFLIEGEWRLAAREVALVPE
jgi:lipopolysaccharide transport system ATP-binding protein